MSFSNEAQNQNNGGDTSSNTELVSVTFRFSFENVSQLTKIISTPVTVAGVEFRCIASHIGDHLKLAVITNDCAGGMFRVTATLVHKEDQHLDIARSEDVTFDQQNTALQWHKIANWDQVVEQDGAGFVTGGDSMSINVCIESVDLRMKVNSSLMELESHTINAPPIVVQAPNVRNKSNELTSSFSGTPAKRRRTDDIAYLTYKVLKLRSTLRPMADVHQSSQTEDSNEGGRTNNMHQSTQTKDTGNEVGIFSPESDLSAIPKLFECSVCRTMFQPPISLCRRGHSVCAACRPRVKHCPTCKAPFPIVNARNFTLERIMDHVLYPCSSDLCAVRCTLADKAEHELECRYRGIVCLARSTGQPRCTWKGPICQYDEHIGQKHPDITQVEDNTPIIIRFPLLNIHDYDKEKRCFFTLRRRILCLSLSQYDDNLYACVKMFGTPLEAKQFTCEMQLSSQYPVIDYKFQTTFQVHSDLEKQHGKCISLSTSSVFKENGLIDVDGRIHMTIRVHRK